MPPSGTAAVAPLLPLGALVFVSCLIQTEARAATVRHSGWCLIKMTHQLLDLVRQHRQRIDLPQIGETIDALSRLRYLGHRSSARCPDLMMNETGHFGQVAVRGSGCV